MKDIYIGIDLFGEKVFWKDLHANSSVLIAGLSGSGKSFLTKMIMDQFLHHNFKVTVISDKAKVDFKAPDILKIDTLEDQEQLADFIEKTEAFMRSRKILIEDSKHSHGRFLLCPQRILIVVDELWSINKLPKELKKKFEDFLEVVIRQGRYLEVYILFVTQISSVAETAIPIRQCSLILTGKTDTKQLSESLFSSDIAYSSDFLRQGMFVIWDRVSPPKFVRVAQKEVFQFSIYWAWVFKQLKKIWTSFR